VRGTPGRPALVGAGRTFSYDDLRSCVARGATLWRDRGLREGEVLMLRGDHGIEHVLAFLSAIWAGGVPIPVRTAEPGFAVVAVTGLPLGQPYAEPRVGHEVFPPQAWSGALQQAAACRPWPCEPSAPACWTEPRERAVARMLPHRFALRLMAQPGVLEVVRTHTMLGTLRALRRGVTVVLEQPAQREILGEVIQ
jgi:hypothetical protein